MPLTDEDKKILKEMEEYDKKMRKDLELLPIEYRFHPISDKFCEGVEVPSQWLMDYLHFRGEHKTQDAYRQELRRLNQPDDDFSNRVRGAFLGLVLGDALGTTNEFKSRRSVTPISDIVGGGPFKLDAGAFTDDTSMALCLAHSLVRQKRFDPKDQMDIYTLWWRHGAFGYEERCVDIGNTVKQALLSYEKTREPYSGSTDTNSAGNGSLMRLVPIPLFYHKSFRDTVYFAGESSKITHGAIEAVDACRYFAGLIHGALQGLSKDVLLSGLYESEAGYWDQNLLCPKVRDIALGSYKKKSADQIKTSGYVIDTLEAALWAFHTTSDFKSGALLLANMGDDSDTTAAVYGQLAGAFYGEYSLPIDWIRKIYFVHTFYMKAMDLVEV